MELKQLGEQLASAHTELKDVLARMEAESKKFGDASQETKNSLEAIQTRMDQIEAKMNRPGAGPEVKDDAEEFHRKSFVKALRRGDGGLTADEAKALSTDSDPDGGYYMAPAQRGELIQRVTAISPIRELSTVITLDSSNVWEAPLDEGEVEGGWVAERGSREDTATSKAGMVRIEAHEYYAMPKLTQRMLEDQGFDIEAWLNGKVATKFAKDEGKSFLLGSGVGQPQGILTADLGLIASGAADGIEVDALIDLQTELGDEFQQNATWLFHRLVLRELRKKKDLNGNYIFQTGVAGSFPATILDRPYRTAPDMPTIAAGAKAVLYGDFRQGYNVVDRTGVDTQRDNVTLKGWVKFYTRRRVGGGVVLADAFKAMKIGATL